jgi:Uma2 family endonuclease
MSTATEKQMARADVAETTPGGDGVVVLRRVPFKLFKKLRLEPANSHLRMTYYDGTLEIMSPAHFEHENTSELFGMIVRAVGSAMGLPCKGSASATFMRDGGAIRKGKSKQPDRSYYLGNAAKVYGKKQIDLDAGDPPPDLWIEIDDRGSSKGRLPVYAKLGVPEVWRYRVKTKALTFLRLGEDGSYHPVNQSLALPGLKPAEVLEALAMGSDGDEAEWDIRIRAWFRGKFGPPR